MKKTLIAVVLLSVFCVLSACYQSSDANAQQQKKSRIQRSRIQWEYKELTRRQLHRLAEKGSENKLTDGLNKLGADGWELVAIEPSSPDLGSSFVFKRDK